MTIGIIPNTTKENINDIVEKIVSYLNEFNFKCLISDSLLKLNLPLNDDLKNAAFVQNRELYKGSDIVLSIGGDGTLLQTAYESREFSPPILGVNFGKLGFLAEFDINKMREFIRDLKEGKYTIEERMTLTAVCKSQNKEELFAINDVVIDKGRWPKMIDLTLKIGDEYVSTFSADGVILSTPTGSTGYSLSVGGPIIDPRAEAITISPLSPHTLTMRPLVISNKQTITIEVNSLYQSVQINCDGSRVHDFKPPVKVMIKRNPNPIRLVHSLNFSYYKTLRNKLLWGLDLRNEPNNRS